MTVAFVVTVFALFMGGLFISGFWTPHEKRRLALPHYEVRVTRGNAPVIELREKAVSIEVQKVTVGATAATLKSGKTE